MAFDGPDASHYGNLRSLNRRFLELAGKEGSLRRRLNALPESLREKLRDLRRIDIDRLSEAPFLLFSFHEHDDEYWDRILARPDGPGLFAELPSPAVQTAISAGLGYAWHLAQQNPFTLRLMSGVPLSWCERIADLSIHDLLDAYHRSGDAPALRFACRQDIWRLLLGGGINRRPDVRQAAQFTALHSILSAPVERSVRLRAASRLHAPGLRVADQNDPQF